MKFLVDVLDRTQLIGRERLGPTLRLAWPRMVTGLARMSKHAADLAMVGWAVGPNAVAGMAFAYAYWLMGSRLSLGLAGGALSYVSQNYAGGEHEAASGAVKVTTILILGLIVPFSVLLFLFPSVWIELLGAGPDALSSGATYLRIVSAGIVFEAVNKIGSRTFAAIGDTRIPMWIRSGAALVNIVLNVFLIFGLGLGVRGAALGTVIATACAGCLFAWSLIVKRFPGRGHLPVGFSLSPPHWDPEMAGTLLSISTPLIFRRLADTLVIFPLLWVSATFGTITVAAFEIGRRVRDLLNTPTWGFSIASSTLVGQHLGRNEDEEAEVYGWEILRFSTLCYVLLAAVVIAFNRPVSKLFVSDPVALPPTQTFVILGAMAMVGRGMDGSSAGALRGSGDTTWPFLGKLFGLYLLATPLAYAGALTQLGIYGLYAALLLEAFVPAGVNIYRFQTNQWKQAGKGFRPDAGRKETA